jgi:Flp pilus assembly pilin Flp
MMHLLRRLISQEEGQDLIEYVFLAVFLALAVTLGMQALGAGLNTHFSNVGSQVSSGS